MKELIENLEIGAEKKISISEQYLSISSRDPKDNKLLACAIGGDANYLVTGNRDLLELNGHPKIADLKIVSPHDFLKILKI
ncbi:MAG: putative toxin-antitoxin system toxin component, PIN family [Nanoarchaeota archaeon]